MAFLSAFICYQTYRIIHRFSLTLIVLTALDVLVVLLIAREYRLARRGNQR